MIVAQNDRGNEDRLVNRRSFLRMSATLGAFLASAKSRAFTLAGQTTDEPQFGHHGWGDQGDGTYKNPILAGDFSDPDVIRVGKDYYFITSTFQYSPGVAIMHSPDLVNWQFIGHAVPDITQIGPEMNWDRMNRYNRGIYAGSIRFHDNKFWIFFATMDEGVFMTTATDPAGPWAPLHRVLDEKGWDDPCPFWDDDGKAYLLLSKPGKEWWTHLFEMTPDGQSIDLASDFVIDNHRGSEGNKLYKFDDTYFVFHNEIQEERVGVMMRSKSLHGPWEEKRILQNAPGKKEREPNQGGLIQTPAGDWWFITQQGRGNYDGRPSFLLPVKWIDGWPIPGLLDKASGAGSILWEGKKPIQGFPARMPQTSDDFHSASMAPQWEWNYQPRAEMWSLTEKPGSLRLKAFRPLKPANFLKVGNVLTQRIMGIEGGEISVRIAVGAMADGQQAGLAHYSKAWGLLGVAQIDGKRFIVYDSSGAVTQGPEVKQTDLWLRSVVDAEGIARASYSLDGKRYLPFGTPYQLTWANYRGDRIGLYCFNDLAEAGYVDFSSFHYLPAGFGKRR
jgi:beta-xylosidase